MYAGLRRLCDDCLLADDADDADDDDADGADGGGGGGVDDDDGGGCCFTAASLFDDDDGLLRWDFGLFPENTADRLCESSNNGNLRLPHTVDDTSVEPSRSPTVVLASSIFGGKPNVTWPSLPTR